MKQWLIYLKYEMKKGMALIPFFLVSALLAGGAVLLAAIIFCAVMDARQLFPKAQVAIVAGSDGTDDSSEAKGDVGLKTNLALGLVQGMESVKSICSFNYMSPLEAVEGLKDGSVDAAIYLPKGVYEDINNGTNTPVLIRLSPRNKALSEGLFAQLVADGASLIRTVETGVYSVDRTSAVYAPVSSLGNAEDQMFSLYVKCALARGNSFTEHGVSLFGSLTQLQFYEVTAILLLLLLFGIGFAVLYNEGERRAVFYMRRSGFHCVKAAAAKLLSATCVLFLLLTLITLAAGVLFPNGIAAGSGEEAAAIPELLAGAFSKLPSQLPMILLIAGTLSILIHVIYSLIPVKHAALLYLLIVIALFCLTGGLLPSPSMSRGLQTAASISPIPLWQKAIAAMLFGGGV